MKACEIAIGIVLALFVGSVHAQNQDAEYSGLLEVYSLSQSEALEMISAGTPGSEVYQEIISKKDADDRLIECLFVRQRDSDRRAILSVEELIYGTEGDPPELPNILELNRVKEPRMVPTDSTFTAFETRNVGFSWDLVMESESDLAVDPFREVSADPFADPVEKPKRNRPEENADASDQMESESHNIDVYMHLEWTVLKEKVSLATDPNHPEERPLAHKWLPRFKTIQVSGEFTLENGIPSLLRIERSPRDTEEMVAIFVTARLLR